MRVRVVKGCPRSHVAAFPSGAVRAKEIERRARIQAAPACSSRFPKVCAARGGRVDSRRAAVLSPAPPGHACGVAGGAAGPPPNLHLWRVPLDTGDLTPGALAREHRDCGPRALALWGAGFIDDRRWQQARQRAAAEAHSAAGSPLLPCAVVRAGPGLTAAVTAAGAWVVLPMSMSAPRAIPPGPRVRLLLPLTSCRASGRRQSLRWIHRAPGERRGLMGTTTWAEARAWGAVLGVRKGTQST